jgi:two-component system CheB/CheR fusion protein
MPPLPVVQNPKEGTARGPPRLSEDLFVVGVGASAGGLEACKMMFAALPTHVDMAFVLVQHLDPSHESMMVDLLAGETTLTVRQATDGTRIEPNYLYVIPPGVYLSVAAGALQLSQPTAQHGARLPFDFLLHSLAKTYGQRAMAVVLSGTGDDGSRGIQSIKDHGGLVIAQDPEESNFEGMPRSANRTGHVDLILAAGAIAESLSAYRRRALEPQAEAVAIDREPEASWLPEIIELLRLKTGHDFTLYKTGTLKRRIERRMAMASIDSAEANTYLETLAVDPAELDLLAKDLLINVTSFFRDPKIFDFVASTVVPMIVDAAATERAIRIWVAGCSTGEEAYSLVMLFREALADRKVNVSLHVFASDIDSDAVATARAGFYPATIEADVSHERLVRFFIKEEGGYRVAPELRSAVVFSVQDVLTDPPFARLNMISCRNLMIYLGAEAQSKAIAVFHFALRNGGILLLGTAETAGSADGRFEVLAKQEHVYRRIGTTGAASLSAATEQGGRELSLVRLPGVPAAVRPSALADLCRRTVAEVYGPAAILINSRREYLYATGSVDRYVRLPSGYQTTDLLAMVPYELRARLAAAIDDALSGTEPVHIRDAHVNRDDDDVVFNVAVLPVQGPREPLLLVCFVEEPDREISAQTNTADASPRLTVLEQQNQSLRRDLNNAVRSLEVAAEEQRIIDEEVLSVNEEYQSTNEELLTSKEELQSLNEELTALNSQLQETLERQRTTSADLKNILYSTDVATIFLDTRLNIRFFTPATKTIFNIIPSDIGRPLADLSLLQSDAKLLDDVQTVLAKHETIEREIEFHDKNWYIRQVLPYRSEHDRVGGVVITFTDITDRKRTAAALEAAKQEAESATIAKSRFLALASHDLRQPLQTLALLQSLLAKRVESGEARKLVARIGDTLSSMSAMLNTLLDLNQIESGTIVPKIVDFCVGDILHLVQEEFVYPAKAAGIALRVVPCSLVVTSDPRLLEQMVRNLLSNALKYTERGAVLLGCRRHGGRLHIEVWDTGIGIPDAEQPSVFAEYYQVNNPTRELNRGLGLGLSIVQRIGDLLGHVVRVKSKPGKGSVFSIDVPRLPGHAGAAAPVQGVSAPMAPPHPSSLILLVEDDEEVRGLLGTVLQEAGYQTALAADGAAAMILLKTLGAGPSLILADLNLPHGRSGLDVIADLRARLSRDVPAIVLTGDITSSSLRDIARTKCSYFNKPVNPADLLLAVAKALASEAAPPPVVVNTAYDSDGTTIISIVDDDQDIRSALRDMLEGSGRIIKDYPSCEAFLASYQPGHQACLLIDAYLPGMSGLELLEKLHDAGDALPAIMITGCSDVTIAVNAMKVGAFDFIEKPFTAGQLLDSVERAIVFSRDVNERAAWRHSASEQLAGLTPRQRQIMQLVLDGQPSKNIAADLGISQRTVENHRAAIMQRTGATSLPALARLALAASREPREADASSVVQKLEKH